MQMLTQLSIPPPKLASLSTVRFTPFQHKKLPLPTTHTNTTLNPSAPTRPLNLILPTLPSTLPPLNPPNNHNLLPLLLDPLLTHLLPALPLLPTTQIPQQPPMHTMRSPIPFHARARRGSKPVWHMRMRVRNLAGGVLVGRGSVLVDCWEGVRIYSSMGMV
ncbi:hypothetical protein P153DRAFT_408975 [Dothidotthia symphoricarpi CBS 119687]|uniref:Uncharacterized protein n=1 Tax=Dothidotthia symphoricarpi CBS 119687 TaxID=1392245 RepID=A0A6A6AS26_9PLEO|nr:uncharacterized protein P153DRAFT_408975 [Dothidotthia symphoricarpi CBS 119687]KAF2133734.1 hypothetical protein P153DRAFT_408975 [Dothidotthia symphoricarpi CBS 119687]